MPISFPMTPNMMRILALLTLTLALAFAGCSDSTAPARSALAGNWVGSTMGAATESTLNVTISERDQRVSGNGNLVTGNNSLAVTVEGTYVHPRLSLTIRAAGYNEMDYTAELVSGNSITGHLRGSGFVGEQLVIRRQ